MLLEIQISVENWNYKVMKHIYSEDCPSDCPLSRTSVVTKGLLSERFGWLQHVGTCTYRCPFSFVTLPSYHIELDRRERTEAAEGKKRKRVKATNEEERRTKRCWREGQCWDQALAVQYKSPCTALGRQKDMPIIGRVSGEFGLAFGNRMQEKRGSDAIWQHLSLNRDYI